jgi:hypothetical protein
MYRMLSLNATFPDDRNPQGFAYTCDSHGRPARRLLLGRMQEQALLDK